MPSALGGRESAPAVVSWTEDGVRRQEATATPTALVRDLAGAVPRRGPRPRRRPADARGRVPADDRRDPVTAATTRPRGRAAVGGLGQPVAGAVELKEFFRQREAVVFTVLLPGAAARRLRGGAQLRHRLRRRRSCSTSWPGSSRPASWAPACRTWRSASPPSGPTARSRRLAGTPMPKSAYFVGKVVQVLAVTVADHRRAAAHRRRRLRHRPALGRGVVHLRLGGAAGRRGLHAAGDRGLEPGEERALGLGHGHALRARPAVHLRRLLPVQLAARVDADGRRGLPAQVDGARACARCSSPMRWRPASRPAPGSWAGWRWCSAPGASWACCCAWPRSAGRTAATAVAPRHACPCGAARRVREVRHSVRQVTYAVCLLR